MSTAPADANATCACPRSRSPAPRLRVLLPSLCSRVASSSTRRYFGPHMPPPKAARANDKGPWCLPCGTGGHSAMMAHLCDRNVEYVLLCTCTHRFAWSLCLPRQPSSAKTYSPHSSSRGLGPATGGSTLGAQPVVIPMVSASPTARIACSHRFDHSWD